jgi:hypothetical protein
MKRLLTLIISLFLSVNAFSLALKPVSCQTEKQKREIVYREVCKAEGAVYIGIQEGIPPDEFDEGIEDMVLFNAKSGTTLAVYVSEFSAESVRMKLILAEKPLLKTITEIPTGELILERKDYIKIIEMNKPRFNVVGLLRAG